MDTKRDDCFVQALGDDTSLPLVSEMNAVSTYPIAAPGSFTGLFVQDSHSALPPELGFTDLSHVTFDHNTGYLWTGAFHPCSMPRPQNRQFSECCVRFQIVL